jgi:hypothetical protein
MMQVTTHMNMWLATPTKTAKNAKDILLAQFSHVLF